MRVFVRAARRSLITATLTLTTAVASAEPSKLLFEERPRSSSAAAPALARLREELGRREVVVSPAEIRELRNEQLPLSGRWDEALTSRNLSAELDAGVRAYLRGQFKAAEHKLEAALALAHRNPALLVSDATSRQRLTQALASLALARLRSGDRAGALEAMAEQVRSFPELPVTLQDFGSRGEALYAAARQTLERGPRGGLVIDVSEPDARIYINEHGRGRGGAFSSDMFPGTYRVLVMVGAQSRLYRISVHADEQTRLAIDWPLDAAFVSSPEWIGLAAAEPHQLRAHRHLARRLAFNDAIVVGCDRLESEPVLWGAVYERGSGRELRRGAIASRDAQKLHRFAEFLVSGRYAREFSLPISALAKDAIAVPPSTEEVSIPTVTWVFGGVGLAAIGAGTYLALSNGASCDACDRGARTSLLAIALIGSGAVSLGVATFLTIDAWRAPAPGSAALGILPLRRGGFATLGWHF
jgi:hypothetical protein